MLGGLLFVSTARNGEINSARTMNVAFFMMSVAKVIEVQMLRRGTSRGAPENQNDVQRCLTAPTGNTRPWPK
jgi:hypothetical protein